ncbi:adenylate/guanylate cyclase domain-containing protein [Solirubrobacter sp. CPCC 204708]|uniref:Adenylate/guanylate cyclase domain-containing protein n=1 Tax=Solirubrobacter deserti TaxID=2282478 RepID=A0ABT4RLJ5_9ACTN|nr:adenylate/guanylate cyclase domain-containing protein [Solirubrobacter deserti]MBE2318972.1 adenylate/guanylate cyclase domain-containing protein [Solirubrobacter deserti]MDA0139303.1 adenylate/guanylate cyclase domain-containing protein [Solirubrobacter deserti]
MRRPGGMALVAIALIAATVGFVFHGTGWLGGAERASVDTRFSIRGEREASKDVVIVAMDDATLKAAGRYPLDRRSHARVIRNLTKAGAGVLAYDVQFTEESDNPDSDNALIEAVADSPRVVLATTEVADDGTTQIFGGGHGIAYSGATESASLLPADGDGVLRQMSMNIKGLPTLSVAAVRALPSFRGLIASDGRRPVDWAGPAGTFRQLRFSDVERNAFPAADVRGKLVVVGATAQAGKDFHRTPVDDHMPGPEATANAAATALAGFPLQASGWWLDALAILALALVVPLVCRWFGTMPAVIAGVLAVAVFLLVAQVLFNRGTIVSVVPPLAAAAAALVLTPFAHVPSRVPLGGPLERLGPRGANPRTRRLVAGSLLGAAALIVGLVLVLQATHALERLELSTVNYRFDVRGSEGPDEEQVLVAIDEYTYTAPPKPTWPFDRHDHADAIRNLLDAGAKVIAYDVQFSERSDDKRADAALEAAIEAARGKIVLATTEVRADGSYEVFGNPHRRGQPGPLMSFSGFPTDDDAKIRRVSRDKDGLPSLSVEVARLASGRPVTPPTAEDNWIDFPGPPETRRTISFAKVRDGLFDPSVVRGKIVMVGATANVNQDRHSTSTSGNTLMAGPEIHMAAVRTALEGYPLRSGPGWLNVLAVVLLGLLAPIAGLRLRVGPALAIGAAGIGVLLVGSQVLFQSEGVINHVAYPFIAGLAAMLVTGIVHGLTTALEREQARDAFARFVPEAVVDQVLADADGVRLGGVRGEATVMFSDLRGFTSFSETLEPERVIEALNKYLTEMSEAILDHGGTLVAYMGDGIMAVFGAPLKAADHADRALDAARDMLSRMDGFNGWLREQGLHDGFKMGIGLNSGPVMSGNVGSERRLEYTALGDTTNTAARLEGMTKGTPHQLYVADSTKQALTRPVDDLVEVGEAEVRGRKAKVKLWSLRESAALAAEEPELAANATQREP